MGCTLKSDVARDTSKLKRGIKRRLLGKLGGQAKKGTQTYDSQFRTRGVIGTVGKSRDQKKSKKNLPEKKREIRYHGCFTGL